jgi:transcription antitermination factor NusG
MRFFTLRVASNKEDRVREALDRKRKIEGLETHVGRIVVPSERVRTKRKARSATATASCTPATSSSSSNWTPTG